MTCPRITIAIIKDLCDDSTCGIFRKLLLWKIKSVTIPPFTLGRIFVTRYLCSFISTLSRMLNHHLRIIVKFGTLIYDLYIVGSHSTCQKRKEKSSFIEIIGIEVIAWSRFIIHLYSASLLIVSIMKNEIRKVTNPRSTIG